MGEIYKAVLDKSRIIEPWLFSSLEKKSSYYNFKYPLIGYESLFVMHNCCILRIIFSLYWIRCKPSSLENTHCNLKIAKSRDGRGGRGEGSSEWLQWHTLNCDIHQCTSSMAPLISHISFLKISVKLRKYESSLYVLLIYSG